MHLLSKLWELITNTLFPPRCVSCKKPHEVLCATCLTRVPPSTFRNNSISALCSYNSPVTRKALWSFKYKNNRALAPVFASMLHDRILEDLHEKEMFHSFTEPLIIPIPLHHKRKRQRGYNQSELIAQELSLKDTSYFTLSTHVLYRYRDTPRQALIQNKKARLQNVRGCFAVKDAGVVRGRTILLIDDITTTGATITEAARVLKKAGAKNVHAYCIAH